MKKFLYIAEGGNLQEMESVSAEMVFRSIAYFYSTNKQIVIIDTETNKATIWRRKIGWDGNLISITNVSENYTIEG